MNLVFLGPPGAGKGTQAEGVARDNRLCHISTGEILRRAVEEGTPVGLEAKEYMDKGELVPDDMVVDMVAGALGCDKCPNGWILDGFPRTLAQAEALDRKTGGAGRAGVELVLFFAVSDASVVKRLSGRRTCRDCGAGYHVHFMPPREEGVCDNCSGELIQREDDKAETILNRLDTYRRQTEPLIGYYRERGLLAEIDASGSPESVGSLLRQALRENFG